MSSKSETAYHEIRKVILSAGVLPGEHLAEIDWSERLGLGRFAIREALKRLHGEGLVSKNRGKYRVTAMTAEEIRQVSHLRAILEVGALRFSGGRVPEAVLREIKEAAVDYAGFVEKAYYSGAREADLRFHRAIVAISENPRLIALYAMSNLPLLHVTVGRNPAPLDDFDEAAAEHNAICAALEWGNTEEAAQLLECHLKRGELEVIGKGSKPVAGRRKPAGGKA